MYKQLYIFLAIIFLSKYSQANIVDNCSDWVYNSFYNLEGLSNPTQNVFVFTDDTTLYWNTCENYVKQYEQYYLSYFVYQDANKNLIYLTGPSIESMEQIDKQNPNDGFIAQYSPSIEQNNVLTVTYECDSKLSIYQIPNPPQYLGDNKYSLKIVSPVGCPQVQLSAIWEFLSEYKYIFIPIMIAFGIFNCFLGIKFFGFTIFTVGFLIAFIIVITIASNLIGSVTDQYINWIVVSAGALAGISFGFLLYKIEKVSFFFLGLIGGFFFAAILYESLLHNYFDEDYIQYIFYGCSMVLGAILGLCLQSAITIIITSFIGSYLLIRSVSLFIKDGQYFPNEFTLGKMISTGQFELPFEFYYFLSAIIILWFIGMISQFKLNKGCKTKKPKEEEEEAFL